MMDRSIYTAPKPVNTFSESVAAILFWSLPPSALWGLTQLTVNKFAGRKLGKKILPAQQNEELKEEAEALRDSFFKRSRFMSANLERLTVQTHDNAQLDTFEITPKNDAEKSTDRTHVIYFNGNGGCYERGIIHMLDNAVELNVNVIGFNYRGVADSTGLACSSDDLIVDGIAQVQRLLDRGVDPEKIVLRGNSLGGAVAALVGQHFHKRDQKVSVFSARSFSTITNAIVAWIRTGYPEDNNETTYRKILGWLAKPFIMLAVTASKWEMDGQSAYQSLPDAYKEYMVVRSSRAKRVPARKDDTIIPHYASLHLALRPERRLVKQRLDFAKNEIQSLSEQCHIVKPDLTASLAKINDARLRLKERKMETAADEIEGHIVNLHELTNRYNGQAGHRFFQQFVSRVSDRSRDQLLSSFNRI